VLFGSAITLAGLLLIVASSNLARGAVALATLLSYVVVYTPLKRRRRSAPSSARFPARCRRSSAGRRRRTLPAQAWTLFGIMFLWQLPHFLAIAWMYREDYARAGSRCCRCSSRTAAARAPAVVYAAALVPLSLAPTLMRHGGRVYFAGALVLGLGSSG
jgi:protoheme IX farnesyltransferase